MYRNGQVGSDGLSDGFITIYECVRVMSTNAFCNPDHCTAGLVDSAALLFDWSLHEQRVVDNTTALAN